jgi:hypothetical protein
MTGGAKLRVSFLVKTHGHELMNASKLPSPPSAERLHGIDGLAHVVSPRREHEHDEFHIDFVVLDNQNAFASHLSAVLTSPRKLAGKRVARLSPDPCNNAPTNRLPPVKYLGGDP